jgi:L-aminopeptidase/D-esterase-like protein
MNRKLFVVSTLLLVAGALSLFAQAKVEPAKPVASTIKAGPLNAITDVPGVEVGSYDRNLTGTTVILTRKGSVGGVDVRGAAPGTRETDLLNPTNMVDKVDAVVLSGGSAYGLAAAHGVMLWLEEHKIGWGVGGGNVVPIVPSAILFDPGRFGRAFTDRPTEEFGRKAAEAASSGPVKMGNVGAGAGAVAGGLKGGLGTASVDLGNGLYVGAIVAINSGGSPVNPQTGELYGAYLGVGDEFKGLRRPFAMVEGGDSVAAAQELYPEVAKNTTIAVVATNAKLTKAQAKKIAEMAHDGLARAIRPVHTMYDGDTIFALGTGTIDLDTLLKLQAPGFWDGNSYVNNIGGAAADALARAVVHAMLNAESVATTSGTTTSITASYRDKFPAAFGK